MYKHAQESYSDLISWCLILSLLFHLFVSKMLRLPTPVPIEKKENFVELMDANDAELKQVVRTGKTRAEIPKDKKAPFASDVDNYVDRQTQAQRKGLYRQGAAASRAMPMHKEGYAQLQPRDLMPEAMSPESIDGVEPGQETVLHTEKVYYASFFHRITEEIYNPWVENVQLAVDRLTREGRKLNPDTYVTRLKLTLNREGRLLAIRVVQGSGVDLLDQAATQAFWQREPFENPPKKMFKGQDQMDIPFEFRFEYHNSNFRVLPFRI